MIVRDTASHEHKGDPGEQMPPLVSSRNNPCGSTIAAWSEILGISHILGSGIDRVIRERFSSTLRSTVCRYNRRVFICSEFPSLTRILNRILPINIATHAIGLF